MTLLLASASPRRRALLEGVGVAVEVQPVDLDETPHPGEPALDYVQRMAREKCDAACARAAERPVLAADTIVVVDGDVLGKPQSDEDARGMLARLAGRAHEVVTAVGFGRASLRDGCVVRTEVHFRAADAAAIARYVATGEGRDKAGSYAVQGIAGGFVTHLVGSYSNVVGLPLAETLGLLERHDVIAAWPPEDLRA